LNAAPASSLDQLQEYALQCFDTCTENAVYAPVEDLSDDGETCKIEPHCVNERKRKRNEVIDYPTCVDDSGREVIREHSCGPEQKRARRGVVSTGLLEAAKAIEYDYLKTVMETLDKTYLEQRRILWVHLQDEKRNGIRFQTSLECGVDLILGEPTELGTFFKHYSSLI